MVNDEKYKDIFNHRKINPLYTVHCIIYATDAFVAHQGIRDLKRHCEGSIHKKSFHLFGCNLPLIVVILRKIQAQSNWLD